MPYGPFKIICHTRDGYYDVEYSGAMSQPQQQVTIRLPETGSVEVYPGTTPEIDYIELYTANRPLYQRLYAALQGGVFRFPTVIPDLVAAVSPSSLVGASGRVEAGQVLQITLSSRQAAGTVYGQVVESDGVSPLIGARLTLLDGESRDASYNQFGNSTTLSGRFLQRDLRPGQIAAIIDDTYARLALGDARLLASGGKLNLNLRNGENNVQRLPSTFKDLQLDFGLVLTGTPFSNDLLLRLNGAICPRLSVARITSSGRGLSYGPANVAGITLERQLYVAAEGGWARFIEILRNPNSVPKQFVVDLNGAAAGRAAITSSGTLPASTGDLWAAVSGSADRASLAFVIGGSSAACSPSVVSFTDDEQYFRRNPAYRYGWGVTLLPGASAAFMHFVVKGTTAEADSAAQAAASLSALTAPGVLDEIDEEVRSIICNFQID